MSTRKLRIFVIAIAIYVGMATHATSAAPAAYVLDTTHSKVAFYITHLGFSNSLGTFKIGDGAISFDPSDWSQSKAAVKIPVDTLDLGTAKWNEHVKSADFLDAARYPSISFKSTKVEKSGATQGKLHGELTIKGVAKPVVLDLRLNKRGPHPYTQAASIGFTAKTMIKRSDFGVNTGLPGVGDDLEIRIEIEASAPKAAARRPDTRGRGFPLKDSTEARGA